MTAEDWEALFAFARRSPNRVRQVGARLDLVSGERIFACNDFPEGVQNRPERHEGDGRFVWMEHAERSAIFDAARRGLATEGAALATTFFPCIDCARAIVMAGVRTVYSPEPDYGDAIWGSAFLRSRVILQEGSVTLAPSEASDGSGPLGEAGD